jgi:hypothetical protein
MSNRRNIQFMYTPHNKATTLDCSFVVDSANGNGLGIRSLKNSGRISSVFMHTTATPAIGNPNPNNGYIVVNLQDNYNRYLGGYSGFVSPVSGTPILVASAGVTAGLVYVIVSLGTTSATGWQSLGLPAGITPAVGVSFVATATTTAAGTGAVEVPATAGSGVDHIEVIGDANLMNNNGAIILGAGSGMQIIMACFKNTVLTAPVDGTVIGMNFYMNDSAQGV